jgi:hypothetical protein
MTDYWNAMAGQGWCEAVPSDLQPAGFCDDESRVAARAEIDAIVARDLFGLRLADLDYLLGTFPIVQRRDEEKHGAYRTKELILAAFEGRDTPMELPDSGDRVAVGKRVAPQAQ